MGQILIEKTIEKFGYSPNDLKPSSEKKVIWKCDKCNVETEKKYRAAVKISLCLQCSNELNANTNKDKRSDNMKNWFKTHNHPLLGVERPEHIKMELGKGRKKANELQRTDERRKIMSDKSSGKNNPMYGKKHNEKSLDKMREFQKTNLAIRGENSNFFGKIYHGRGEWYLCKDGSKVWMRSSWEIKYAKYLDESNVKWLYEPKTFPIVYSGKQGTYTPDFYLIESETYIEIKGWWRDDAFIKYQSFKEHYPTIQIELYDKIKLRELKIL